MTHGPCDAGPLVRIPGTGRLLAGLLLLGIGGCQAAPTSPTIAAITQTGTGATTLTYTTDIQPLLAADCTRCHGPVQRQAGVDLSSYAGVLKVVTAGSDASLLVRVTQPTGLMYNNLSGSRNQKAGAIYDWVVNSKAAP